MIGMREKESRDGTTDCKGKQVAKIKEERAGETAIGECDDCFGRFECRRCAQHASTCTTCVQHGK